MFVLFRAAVLVIYQLGIIETLKHKLGQSEYVACGTEECKIYKKGGTHRYLFRYSIRYYRYSAQYKA